MPTNLLRARDFNSDLYKVNGQLIVTKQRNRIGNNVYRVPNNHAQVCFRTILKDAFGIEWTEDTADDYMVEHKAVRIERMTRRHSYSDNSSIALIGIRVTLPVRQPRGWGYAYPYTTIPVRNGALSEYMLTRMFNHYHSTLVNEHPDVLNRITRQHREMIEHRARQAQANAFLEPLLKLYPLGNEEYCNWQDNYDKVRLVLVIPKVSVGKVLKAVHYSRKFSINQLDLDFIDRQS